MQIRILSIDGGGIRGIIPAMILAEIERRTHRRIADLFHLIAGTSTGGILALGLTVPDMDNERGRNGRRTPKYRALDLVKLYERDGEAIFPSSWQKVWSIGGLFDQFYPSDGIDNGGS